MPNRNLTLGLMLIVAATAHGQTKTYTLQPGDTLSQIAERFRVSKMDLVQANSLKNSHKLTAGDLLKIPSPAEAGRWYAIRNGDQDINIARKAGISTADLRLMNPTVNWEDLEIGSKIRLPKTAQVAVASAPKPATKQKGYVVRQDDNDWVIARKVGMTPSQLRRLNPGTDWSRLKLGSTLQVSGDAKPVVASAQKKIRGRYAVITANRVMVRRGGRTDSDRLAAVDAGTRVAVLDREGKWYKLRFGGGTVGWVREDFLKSASYGPTPQPERVVSRPISTRVAVAPHRAGKKKSTVAQARTKRKKSQFFAARPRASETRVASYSPAAGASVINVAQRYRGVRYRYGAMSRSSTDCSGFTSQVYRSVGVKLPRTSREQANVGASVSRDGLKSGDLVFFRTTRGNRISHVGIYMGGGKFIHASSGGGKVQVNNLSDRYYNARFVKAKRVSSKKVKVNPSVVKKATKKVAPKVEAFPETVPPIND